MSKNTLLLLFIIALFSSQLWNITWNIGTSAFYLIIIIIILNYLNPDSGAVVQENATKIINLDFSLIKYIFSSISKFILSLFTTYKKNTNTNPDSNINTDIDPDLDPDTDNSINLNDDILINKNIDFRKLT